MSHWKVFYRDDNGRNAQSTPSREAVIIQALHLARRYPIQKIQGPNGEVIDRETFEREYLKKHRRPF